MISSPRPLSTFDFLIRPLQGVTKQNVHRRKSVQARCANCAKIFVYQIVLFSKMCTCILFLGHTNSTHWHWAAPLTPSRQYWLLNSWYWLVYYSHIDQSFDSTNTTLSHVVVNVIQWLIGKTVFSFIQHLFRKIDSAVAKLSRKSKLKYRLNVNLTQRDFGSRPM